MLEFIAHAAVDGFAIVVCYVLGYRKGIRSNPANYRPTGKCMCNHGANNHIPMKNGWGKCGVTSLRDMPSNGCACKMYIEKPIEV